MNVEKNDEFVYVKLKKGWTAINLKSLNIMRVCGYSLKKKSCGFWCGNRIKSVICWEICVLGSEN